MAGAAQGARGGGRAARDGGVGCGFDAGFARQAEGKVAAERGGAGGIGWGDCLQAAARRQGWREDRALALHGAPGAHVDQLGRFRRSFRRSLRLVRCGGG